MTVRVKVPMERLGPAAMMDRVGLVSGVAVELATRARAMVREAKLDGTEVVVGKVISNSQQTECGVFLQNGLRIGAVATVRSAAEFEVKVGPLSKLEQWLVWGSLGASLVAGLVAASKLSPPTMAAGLSLALGLLGGVGVGVAAIFGITRFGVGREQERSQQLAVALEALVREWCAPSSR